MNIGPLQWLLLLVLCSGLAHGAIYRYVDEEGNITFTSEPPPGAEVSPVDLPPPNSVATPRPRSADGAETSTATDGYTLLSIAQPEDGAAIRSNAGNITVTLNVGPKLRPSDTVVLYLDGHEVARGRGTVFALENISRGAHQLSAAIQGPDGKALIRSAPVGFNLLRVSVLTRPGRPPAP